MPYTQRGQVYGSYEHIQAYESRTWRVSSAYVVLGENTLNIPQVRTPRQLGRPLHPPVLQSFTVAANVVPSPQQYWLRLDVQYVAAHMAPQHTARPPCALQQSTPPGFQLHIVPS